MASSVDYGSTHSPSPFRTSPTRAPVRQDASWIKEEPNPLSETTPAPPAAAGPATQSPDAPAPDSLLQAAPTFGRAILTPRQEPRSGSSSTGSQSDEVMHDAADDGTQDTPAPPPPATLPMATPAPTPADPPTRPTTTDIPQTVRVSFKKVADSLDFDVQDISRLFKDTIVQSTISSLTIAESFNAVRNRLLKYAQTRSIYLTLRRPGLILIVPATESQLKQKQKEQIRRRRFKFHPARHSPQRRSPTMLANTSHTAATPPTMTPPTGPPPTPAALPPAPALTPRPPSFPLPNQRSPKRNPPSPFVSLARKRGHFHKTHAGDAPANAASADSRSAASAAQAIPSLPARPHPPPPLPPPAPPQILPPPRPEFRQRRCASPHASDGRKRQRANASWNLARHAASTRRSAATAPARPPTRPTRHADRRRVPARRYAMRARSSGTILPCCHDAMRTRIPRPTYAAEIPLLQSAKILAIDAPRRFRTRRL